METWTQSTNGRWKRWSHPGLGLNAISNEPLHAILVVGQHLSDEEQMIAAIELARELAGGRISVIAAHEHPTAAWREAMLRAGADRAVYVASRTRGMFHGSAPLEQAEILGDTICPALHADQSPDGTLSVCGCHFDRMVLGRPHFERWCFARKEACPHWKDPAENK